VQHHAQLTGTVAKHSPPEHRFITAIANNYNQCCQGTQCIQFANFHIKSLVLIGTLGFALLIAHTNYQVKLNPSVNRISEEIYSQKGRLYALHLFLILQLAEDAWKKLNDIFKEPGFDLAPIVELH
jgi:hypothetical protein